MSNARVCTDFAFKASQFSCFYNIQIIQHTLFSHSKLKANNAINLNKNNRGDMAFPEETDRQT